ncbi:hypothetical protein F-VV10_0171 [Faustovirus]|nr:hypothetical protein F-VV10_0171 [Faustovirus]
MSTLLDSPNDIIKEILLAALRMQFGDILIARCFSMTCKRVYRIYQDIRTRCPDWNIVMAIMRLERHEWRVLSSQLIHEKHTHYSTKFITGLIKMNPDIIQYISIIIDLNGTCSSRLFSALIKSRLFKISHISDKIARSWILWAIRKVGVDSILDIKKIISLHDSVLLHEAIEHASCDLDLHNSNLHYIVARYDDKNPTILHEMLTTCAIMPTVVDLKMTFLDEKYESTKWMYRWLVDNTTTTSMDLKCELYNSDISTSNARILADIKAITSSSEQEMVAFICRYSTYDDLIDYVNKSKISLLDIDVRDILNDGVNDAKIVSCLLHIANNSVALELSDSSD